MASLTIRKLDEAVKAYLRLRSAGNDRSVEEEVRVILGELIQGRPELPGGGSPPHSEAPTPPSRPPSAASERRLTPIIGSGIAAHKALDLIRPLKDRRYPPQRTAASTRWNNHDRTQCRRNGRSGGSRAGANVGAAGNRGCRRRYPASAATASAGRQTRADHGGADA